MLLRDQAPHNTFRFADHRCIPRFRLEGTALAQVDAPGAATEFVGTSNICGGNGVKEPKGLNTPLTENPFVKFHNQRGYVRCAATPKEGKSDHVIAEKVTKLGGEADVRARSSSKPTMSVPRRHER